MIDKHTTDPKQARTEVGLLVVQLRALKDIPAVRDCDGSRVVEQAIALLERQHRAIFAGPKFVRIIASPDDTLYAMDVRGRVYEHVSEAADPPGEPRWYWRRLKGDDNRDPRPR